MAPTRRLPSHPYAMEAAAAPCAGVDEAGRGCLAGPVVAAAVILPRAGFPANLQDSKKLAPKSRERLRKDIIGCGAIWSVGVVWQKRIDEINILQASLEAMAKAVLSLKTRPATLLIDGNQIIPEYFLDQTGCKSGKASPPAQKTIVSGDALVPCISAASIMAKTFRDSLMVKLAKRWPGYGFEQHKGYGTKGHYAALRALGPCPLHRFTFRGVVSENMPCLPGMQSCAGD